MTEEESKGGESRMKIASYQSSPVYGALEQTQRQ